MFEVGWFLSLPLAMTDIVRLQPSAILGRIYEVRSVRIMLDEDLAELYGVSTKRLNEQVKRNLDRFPSDFAFRLTAKDIASLRSQIATSKTEVEGRGGRRYAPMAFTEHGILMLSSVLNSDCAVQVNIHIMRTFVRLNRLLSAEKDIARKLDRMEGKVIRHDHSISALVKKVKELAETETVPRKRFGYKGGDEV
jgi:ORF6N domain